MWPSWRNPWLSQPALVPAQAWAAMVSDVLNSREARLCFFYQFATRRMGGFKLRIEVAGFHHQRQSFIAMTQSPRAQPQVVAGGRRWSQHFLRSLEHGLCVGEVPQLQKNRPALEGQSVVSGRDREMIGPDTQHGVADVTPLAGDVTRLARQHRKKPRERCAVPAGQPERRQNLRY